MMRLARVGEGGGVGRHLGHCAAEDPQLGDPHRRVGGLQVPHDGAGHGPVDGVDEHGPETAVGWYSSSSAMNMSAYRIGWSMSAIGSARARNGARACSAAAASPAAAEQRQHDQLAVGRLGQERHRRGDHDVADPRQLLGGSLGGGHEALDDLGAGRQQQHPADGGGPRAAGTGSGSPPRSSPTAPDGPEQVGVVLGVDLEHLAVGGHDLGGEQAVDGQAELADGNPTPPPRVIPPMPTDPVSPNPVTSPCSPAAAV